MEPAHQCEAQPERVKWRALVALARPHQWVKNGLLLAALVFSKRLFHLRDFSLATLGLAAFCALASAGYAVNDLADREADRVHPEKRNRPLARGDVSPREGLIMAVGLAAAGLGLSLVLGAAFLAIAAGYLGLAYSYSNYLKRVVVLDVIVVALGFVLRAYAGGAAIGVAVSQWLVFTTFLLALLLALARRRHELLVLGGSAATHRDALRDYSVALIDQMLSIVAAATMVAYMIYTVSPEVEGKLGTRNLYLTVPFVVFGIFRYLYLVQRRSEGGDPSRLLITDRPLLATLTLWVAADVAVLYL